jgi:hypothetical protein
MIETASMSGDADVAAGDLNLAQPRSHIVSPVVLERNDEEEDDFLTGNLCPFLMSEPPVAEAFFDVQGNNGQLSQQVFEYSHLYKCTYQLLVPAGY